MRAKQGEHVSVSMFGQHSWPMQWCNSVCGRYTVNGAVFTATPGENGGVSDYNENNGSTRELRSVTLSVGTRVKLPGYDRLPGATGTVAYLGPEKVSPHSCLTLPMSRNQDALGRLLERSGQFWRASP